MNQIVFSECNLEYIYMSPYCDYKITPTAIFFTSKLSLGTAKVKTNQGEDLICLLEKGISYNELCAFLSYNLNEKNPEQWISKLFGLKILE